MEIYKSTVEGGYYIYSAIWNQENDSLVWNVTNLKGEICHLGTEHDNIIDIIRAMCDDYTLSESLELAKVLITKAHKQLEYELFLIENDRCEEQEERDYHMETKEARELEKSN